MRTIKSQIFWKLIFAHLISILIILLFSDFYLNHFFAERHVNQVFSKLRTNASILLAEVPDLNRWDLLRQWTQSASNRTGSRITIIDAGGAVLTDSEYDVGSLQNHRYLPEVQDVLAGNTSTKLRYSDTAKSKLAYVAVPIRKNSNIIGVLRLALSLQEIEAEIEQIRRRIIILSLIALTIGGSVAYFFCRSLTRRIEQIADFSETVAGGNFSERLKLRERDELSKLGESLNVTADKLQKTIEQLVEERNKIEAVLSSMAEGVLAVDSEKRVILANPAFNKTFGINSSFPLGKTVLEATRNNELDEIIDAVLNRGAEIKKFTSVNFPQEKIFEAVALPLFSKLSTSDGTGNKMSGGIVVLRDTTEQKRLETMRKDFIANVSHELRTPLAAIKGYAETLLAGALDDRDHRKHFVEVIHNHANRLSRITEDLLMLSSIESTGFRYEMSQFDIRETIDAVLLVVKEQVTKKEHAIELILPPDLPLLWGDKERICEVLLNLLDNAVKFTPEKGRIRIMASSVTDSSTIEISVSDTGIGIPQKDLPRVFERFYRVDKARSRKLGGTGLGLSIVKHIVEAHGGRVWVKSLLGQGSTFTFTVRKGRGD